MSLRRSKHTIKNPFLLSDDNLRYHTYSYYLKNKYHQKVFKIPLDAGFSCPNRDGTCGFGGCLFCSSRGSGDTIIRSNDIYEQFLAGKQMMMRKWPSGLAIAYFQAYTNNHASLTALKALYDPFVLDKSIVEIAIATRPDCLDDEKIAYFQALNKIKPITIELGLQSINDETMMKLNRGHDLNCLNITVKKLQQANIRVCLHIINGLPNENEEMMLTTAKHVARLNVDGIKIHMLHIIKNTKLAEIYGNNPFYLLSKNEYVDIVIKQLEFLPASMVIERVTGDALVSELIAPLWTSNKTIIRNDIAKEMVKRDTYQGKYYETN